MGIYLFLMVYEHQVHPGYGMTFGVVTAYAVDGVDRVHRAGVCPTHFTLG